jgi:hypothetical protein
MSLAQAQHALRLTGELLRVSDALDAAGIPFLTFKGPTLSLSLYGDVGTRRYGDVDLLLPARRVVEARGVLAGLGYRPYLDVTDRQLAWATTFLNEYAMVKDGVMVELHWAVVRPGYRFSLAYEELAQHRTTTELAGRKLPVLRNEALLVVLAVHGSKHGWSRRSWLTDFADLGLRETSVDWTEVFSIADQHDATRFVLQAARLAERELGASIPPVVRVGIARDRGARVAATMAARGPREGHDSFLSYMAAMSDTSSRLRALREVFIDPTLLDCQLVDLPERLYPLYHVVRPVRLLGKHVFRLRHRPWSR